MFRFRSLLVTVALGLILASNATAFEVRLSKLEIRSPSDSTLGLQISNSGATPLAVELSVHKRSYDKQGKEDYSETFEDIIAVPPQLVVPPGQQVTASLHWLKPEMPENEIPLRVVAAQVPVDWEDKPQGNSLSFNFRMVKSLYIKPEGASPDIRLAEVIAPKEAGAPATLVLKNVGTMRQFIDHIDLQGDGGEEFRVGIDQMLLSGNIREIPFELPEDVPLDSLQTIQLQKVNGR